MLVLRSLAYHVAFYVTTAVMSLVTLPGFLFLPRRRVMGLVRAWIGISMWLLKVVAGVQVEFRGRQHLVGGASIVAPKHQSTFETLALIPEDFPEASTTWAATLCA